MLIGRQTRFWSADWSCHIKNMPHRLPSPTTKFSIRPTVARRSADRWPTAFPWRATCNESADCRSIEHMTFWCPCADLRRRTADLRATVGRPIEWHFGVRAPTCADDRPTCERRSVDRSYGILASMRMRPSADRRPIVGRRSSDAEPITKTQKSSGDRKKK